MGWTNGGYPSAPRDTDQTDERLECEGFRCAHRIEPGMDATCREKYCHRTILCDGCTHECESCHRTFCRDHILVHEQADRFATYRCVPCDRVRQAEEKAA